VLGHVTWDTGKAALNWRKHGVRFEEARTIFYDPLLLSSPDVEHSTREERFTAIGAAITGELLVVAYTIRNDDAWIISARRAERAERRRYMEGERIRDEAEEVETIPTVDFSNAVRGRHHIAPRGPIVVEIEPVVAEFFRDAEAVNAALRMLIAEGRAPEPLPRSGSKR
jgi:uncharacterized protein